MKSARARWVVGLLFGAISWGVSAALRPGDRDPTFSVDLSREGVLEAFVVATDGKVYAWFTSGGGNAPAEAEIARFLPDGRRDPTFSAKGGDLAGRLVMGMAADSSGGIWVAPTRDKDRNPLPMLRLGDSGEVEQTIVMGPGSVMAHDSLASDPRGGLFIAGAIEAGGAGLQRFDPDGNLDQSFGRGRVSVDMTVYSFSPQPDGSAWIGGQFTTVGGIRRHGVAHLLADGSVDPKFQPEPPRVWNFTPLPGTLVFPLVTSVIGLPDGRVLAAGEIRFTGATPAAGIVRYLADGRADPTFGPTGCDGPVDSMMALPGGGLLVGGRFTRFGPHRSIGLARLDADGRFDPTWLPDLPPDSAMGRYAVAPDGKVFAAGICNSGPQQGAYLVRLVIEGETPPVEIVQQPAQTTRYSGESTELLILARGLADLRYQWRRNGQPLAGETNAVIVFPEVTTDDAGTYDVLAMARDRAITSKAAHLLILPQSGLPGSVDLGFNAPFSEGTSVGAVAALADESIVAAGMMVFSAGLPMLNLVRLTSGGAMDTNFLYATQVTGSVGFLHGEPNGLCVAAGGFAFFGGEPALGMVRFHPDGRRDSSFRPSVPERTRVLGLSAASEGRYIVAYTRDILEPVPPTLVRLLPDGGLDPTFNGGVPVPIPGQLLALAVQAGDRVLVSRGAGRGGSLVRFDGRGVVDPTFDSSAVEGGIIQRLLACDDGRVVFAASFFGDAARRFSPSAVGIMGADGASARVWDAKGAHWATASALLDAGEGRFLAASDTVDLIDSKSGTGIGFGTRTDGSIVDLAQTPPGDIVIAGDFKAVDGIPRRAIARLYWRDRRAPVLLGPFVAATGIRLVFDSLLGWNYALEGTPNPDSSIWTHLGSFSGTGRKLVLEDPNWGMDRRFYRVKARPAADAGVQGARLP